MKRIAFAGALLALLAGSAWAASMSAGSVALVTTGGTAVNAVVGPVNGCYIANPSTATDQGISTAETLYVDPVSTATTAGSITNFGLTSGRAWTCPSAIPSGRSVSVNAATNSHKFTVVVW